MDGETKADGRISAFCGVWPSWLGVSSHKGGTAVRVPPPPPAPPLTLCTSMRSSVAGHRHKSAPGCAGLQAGEQSCTSSPQQSALGAHHCSSARDCTEWLGNKRMHSVPPGLSGHRQQGQQSALRSWLCDLSYRKNL